MKLKEIRKAANKTQLQVSKDLNISQQNLCRYETGQNEPDIVTLKKLAQYFHVTIDYLLDYEVPYLLDKSILTNEQNDLIDKITNLDREQCMLVDAYIEGLKVGKRKQEDTIKKLRGINNDKN